MREYQLGEAGCVIENGESVPHVNDAVVVYISVLPAGGVLAEPRGVRQDAEHIGGVDNAVAVSVAERPQDRRRRRGSLSSTACACSVRRQAR